VIEVPEVGQPEKVVARARSKSSGNNQYIARFTGLPTGPDHVYLMRLVNKGQRFQTKPFMMSAVMGAGRSLLVLDRPIIGAHIAAELDDENLRFQIQYNLQNYSGVPIDTGTEGIELPLPDGAIGGQAGEENGSQLKMNPGKSVTWRGVIQPGSNTFIIAFQLPIHDGVATYRQFMPLGLFESMVIVEKPPGAKLDIGEFRQDARQNEQGRSFFVVPRIDIRPEQILEFTVSGLPRPRAADRWARVIVGFLVAFVLAGAVVATLLSRPPRAAAQQGSAPSSRRKQLTAEREKLYDKLVDLEKKRAAARVDADDYASEKQQVVARLTLILRELEQLDAGSA
jgi:hypothetical protein